VTTWRPGQQELRCRTGVAHQMTKVTLFALAALLLAPGCGREERTVNVRGSFHVERDAGRPDVVGLEGRAYHPRISEESFRFTWDAVNGRGSAGGTVGVMLTLSGGGSADAAGVAVLTGMMLAVPLPLTAGATYPVTGTFPPPGAAYMPMYWEGWGERRLVRAGEGEVALRVFDYHTIGMRVENEFIATAVNGTVQVTARYGDQVELRLDITASDAAGRQLRLHGDFTASNERYTPPFS
jgi:hypothetical protein